MSAEATTPETAETSEPRKVPLSARFLGLMGRDDPETVGPKLHYFLVVILMALTTERLMDAINMGMNNHQHFWQAFFTPISSILAIACLYVGAFVHPVLIVLFLSYLPELMIVSINYANHYFLGFYVVTISALFYGKSAESKILVMQILRWVFFGLIFGSAVQKIVHGAWFEAEFLNAMVSHGDWRFVALYNFLGLEEEVARLQPWKLDAGTGPYNTDIPLLLVFSNSVWIMELVLPLLLLFDRTRMLGVVSIALMMIGVEAVAQEMFFGVIVFNFFTLFLPRGWAARPAWVFKVGVPAVVFAAGHRLAILIGKAIQ